MSGRVNNWPSVMITAIEAAHNVEFEWGACDCALFAADVVKAMTGTDYAAAFRGRYHSPAGAVRALKKYGHGSLTATATAFFGEPMANINFARRGDLVMALIDSEQALGINLGSSAAFKAPGSGVSYRALTECRAAWRID